MADAPKPPPLNPTPKQQFAASKRRISDHLELMASPQFQDSINMALLQYTTVATANVSDANGAALAGMKIKGAQEFVDVLCKLALMPVDATKPESQKLNYRV